MDPHDAILEQLDNPPPSDVERADSITIYRLAGAAGFAAGDH